MSEADAERTSAVDALRDLNFAVQAFREAVADHFGLGVRETQAAAHLVTHGQLGAGDLSRLLDLTPSTITHLLGRIDRAGLAIVTTDPDDHRRSLVRPTDRARDMVADIRTRLDSCFDGFDAHAISPAVVLQVIDVLTDGLRDARTSLRATSTASTPRSDAPSV